MKRISIGSWSRGLACALVFGVTGGCGITMLELKGVAGVVPPEAGKARVWRKDDGTAQVDVRISDVTPVQSIAPGAAHYVIWAVMPDRREAPRNLGTLQVSQSGTGRFHTFVEDTSVSLFMTAEATSLADRPTGEALLWTRLAPGPRKQSDRQYTMTRR